ncbi:rRNA-processing protein EFG1 [Penicillium expansum]|nr:rRNA-processing protein EFG1 [Penicillium expansum]
MSTDTRSHRDREAPSKRKTRDGRKGDASKPKVTRKYKDKFAPKPEKEYPSINDLKKRIRDVKRLLNKMDLSADARILQERALAGYEQDLADETTRRERSSLIKKYHFVRFLDRKTAIKELNRLTRREKEEDLDSKQKARLAAKIHTCQVNINYAIYYPLTEKYISIYPNGKPDAADPGSELQKEETKSNDAKPPVVLHINANGEKIQTSSSSTATVTDAHKEKSKTKETKAPTQKEKHASKDDKKSSKKEKPARSERASKKHEEPQPANTEDQDDSDGGFFE